MTPSQYPTVACIANESEGDLRLYLEMLGIEVVLSPGHSIELLARPSEGLLPITVDYIESGLQVHPHKEFDPDWHVKFKGKLIRVDRPIRLSEHE
jgi:hypothetical protein